MRKKSDEDKDIITLVVLAAGVGRRFGKGIKQLEPVGPCNETMIDYSVNDALSAGFGRVIFVIQKEFDGRFKGSVGERISKITDVGYAYPEILLEDDEKIKEKSSERKLPWGTTCSLLSIKDMVEGPFAVINADDFYGKEAYERLFGYLSTHDGVDEDGKHNMVMMGYRLKNTLSENGSVTRGICTCNEDGVLVDIRETKDIRREGGRIISPGALETAFSDDTLVSMNMWGMYPGILDILEKKFHSYIRDISDVNEGECLIPESIDEILREHKVSIEILKTSEKWFGITYKEDLVRARENIKKMTDEGRYASPLFGSAKDNTFI